MSNYTPGPWRAPREPNGKGHGWQAGPAWLGSAAYSEETAANARLIAAAPELLDVLLEIEKFMGADFDDLPMADKARAAIAKAEGEP